MNGWNLFTWLNCGFLATSAVIIFGFFCRDAGGILKGQREDPDLDPAAAPPAEKAPLPPSDQS